MDLEVSTITAEATLLVYLLSILQVKIAIQCVWPGKTKHTFQHYSHISSRKNDAYEKKKKNYMVHFTLI
jgi:hypothetical protein